MVQRFAEMNFLATNEIEGVVESEAFSFLDERGSLKKIRMNNNFYSKEVFFTTNNLGTFRGMHLQWGTHSTQKLITIVSGRVYQFLVDCRPNSPSFRKLKQIELDSDSPKSIHIPEGVAQGYVSLSANTIVLYQMNKDFCPSCDLGFKSTAILDKVQSMFSENIILNKKDMNLPDWISPSWH
jgi:dTDP-4-dehydrorhamnose 3,5-epimerase